MFREALDFALDFIGIQPEDTGCSAAELSEFLLQDVAPYCGQAGNTSLRDTVVLLLLSEHSDAFRVLRLPTTASQVGQESRSGAKRASVGSSSFAVVQLRAQVEQAAELAVGEATRLLGDRRIQWEAANSPSAAPAAGLVSLQFVPKIGLREKALGFPLHTESMQVTARYLCDNVVQGWVTVRNRPENRGRYKHHLLSAGLRKLRQRHIVDVSYVVETVPKVWVTNRWFPAFALPLTEPEKLECDTGSGTPAPVLAPPAAADATSSSAAVAAGLSPSEFVAYRGKRGNWPIHHYLFRLRSRAEGFPTLVLDLGLVKHVVKSSPEGNLLYQDAIHAVFAAHAIHGLCLPKRSVAAMKRVMDAAGLRVVRASIVVRGKSRCIKLVIPVEDLLRHLQERRAKERRERSRAQQRLLQVRHSTTNGELGGIAGEEEEGEEGEDEAESGRDDAGSRSENRSIDWTTLEEEGRAVGQADDDDSDDNGEEGEEGEHKRRRASSSGGAAAMGATAKSTGSQTAFAPFYMSPDFPLELQVGGEAERRPLALGVVYPRMRFETPEKIRRGLLDSAMGAFMKEHQTLETRSVVEKGSKAFSTIYTLREGVALGDRGATAAPQGGVKKEEGEEEGDEKEVKSLALPKGLSQYAVDTVMDALQSAPRHAATMNRLGTLLDATTLSRRLLPYLRSIGKVTSTGVTPRGKRRIGIVALADALLSEQDKVDLVEEERLVAAAAVAATAEAATTQALVHGSTNTRPDRGLETSIVLDEVPAIGAGVEPSKQAQQLRTVSTRTKNIVSKLMLIRNGYARQSLCRAGRLHLELWKQWHEQAAALDEDGLPVSVPESTLLSMQAVYDNMSLSTFCIVFGFDAFDLATVLGTIPDGGGGAVHPSDHSSSGGGGAILPLEGKGGGRQTRLTDFLASATTRRDASPRDGSTQGVAWSTPLRDLPPSVREWCGRQGSQSLHLALQTLQQRRLIRCDTFIDPFLDTPLMDLSFSLCSTCTRGSHSYTLFAGGGRMSRAFTPSSTAYAVLRYWQPLWSALTFAQTARALPSVLLDGDTDMGFAQLTAVARITRKDPGVLAEALYQCCGWRRVQRSERGARLRGRPGPLSQLTSSSATHFRRDASKALRQTQPRRRASRWAWASTRGVGDRRRASETPRVFITGAAIEGALASALAEENPRRRVEEVLHTVDRLRRKAWWQRPLGTPATFLRQNGSKRRGDDAWLLTLDPNAAWLGGFAAAGGHTTAVADTTALTVLGRGEYDRDASSTGTLHSGILACVLKEALLTQSKLSASGAAFGARGAAADIVPLLRATFSPNALLPHGTHAGSGTDSRSATGSATSSTQLMAHISAAAAAAAAAAQDSLLDPQGKPDQQQQQQQQRRRRALRESLELAVECLRMILLSDNAHYHGDIARDLLLAFPRGVVTRARAHLQRCASFRAWAGRGRVPELALSARPFIFPPGVLKAAPRRCTNAALLHSWAAALDAVATAACKGRQCALTAPGALDGGRAADTPFDVSVVEQPTMDVQSIVEASAEASTMRSEQGSTQRTVGSEAALRRRVEVSMRALRLPVMAWPQRSFALEATQLAAADEEEALAARARAHRHGTARKRSRTEADDDEADADAVKEEEGKDPAASGENADDSTDEEEDAGEGDGMGSGSGGGLRGPGGGLGGNAAALYPSRSLFLYDDDVSLLEAIPVTPPPTAEERERMQQAIAEIRTAHERDGGPPPQSDGWRPFYPSVFHHTDGTFNEYVWRYALLSVYQFILRVPGVAESELRARATASGLLGPHSFAVVVGFLCDSGVLVRTAGVARKPTVYTRCPLLPLQPPRRRPRVEEGRDTLLPEWGLPEEEEEEDEAYLTATVCPSGLWNITRL